MVTYDTGYAPDPGSAIDVLAFVLCPAAVFAAGHPGEREAIAELLRPVKAEAVRKWSREAALRRRV